MRKSISQLNMLSPEEYGRIVREFNNTAVDYPRDKCVHTLFEEQVAKTPDKVAVIAQDKTLTYKELNEQANRIAHSLIEKVVKPNDIIAFMLPRKSYLLSVMFGILKSGAAYMPIDPDYPQDRIDYMLKDSGAKFCITEDNIDELLDNEKTSNPNIEMSSDNLCYCIYTSGSTGKPKGTLLKHLNVCNYCDNNNNNVVHSIIKENYKTIVSVTTIGFDIFVTESILPLLNKKTIILADENQSKISHNLNELLAKHPADILQTTPTKMKSLISDKSSLLFLNNIKAFVLGGEALDEALVEQLTALSSAKIYNIYGPTETTVWSTNTEIIKTKSNIKSETNIKDFSVFSNKEKHMVMLDFNSNKATYPDDKCIHKIFEELVSSNPDKIALVFSGVEFTYSKLNSMANAVATELQKSCVGRNDIVAIISKRSYHTVVAILAILKVGAAYLPIDYNYPIDRINYILKDSNCKSALTYGIDFEVNNQICMEQIDYNKDYANLETKADNMDLCAVIYTSGSTGEPKGTLLHHKGVVNYAFGNDALYCGGECVISYATYTFDAFLLDTVLPMIRGTKCVLATEEEQFSQKPFEKLIESNNNCNMFITPAKLKQFILGSESKEFLKNISKICIGGEMFPTELLPYFDEKTQIFNVYGPTECSLWMTEGRVIKKRRVNNGISIKFY